MIRKVLIKRYTVITIILAIIFVELLPLFVQFSVLNDININEVSPNFFGVIVLYFVTIYLTNADNFKKLLMISVTTATGIILYEFIQLIIPWQTFDWLDIMVSLVALIVCIIISYKLSKSKLRHDSYF